MLQSLVSQKFTGYVLWRKRRSSRKCHSIGLLSAAFLITAALGASDLKESRRLTNPTSTIRRLARLEDSSKTSVRSPRRLWGFSGLKNWFNGTKSEDIDKVNPTVHNLPCPLLEYNCEGKLNNNKLAAGKRAGTLCVRCEGAGEVPEYDNTEYSVGFIKVSGAGSSLVNGEYRRYAANEGPPKGWTVLQLAKDEPSTFEWVCTEIATRTVKGISKLFNAILSIFNGLKKFNDEELTKLQKLQRHKEGRLNLWIQLTGNRPYFVHTSGDGKCQTCAGTGSATGETGKTKCKTCGGDGDAPAPYVFYHSAEKLMGKEDINREFAAGTSEWRLCTSTGQIYYIAKPRINPASGGIFSSPVPYRDSVCMANGDCGLKGLPPTHNWTIRTNGRHATDGGDPGVWDAWTLNRNERLMTVGHSPAPTLRLTQ